ncbi:MAG: TusE/DsrC/DsvC family sulfur relay protein [Thermoanaerobaculia bacterium]|nr:TusE/DsrC/DsvC family sulfur relay protein [Thermoanaerobaculia bacterium]
MSTWRSEWTPSLAECVARVYGIDPLTESHWRVISACREEFAKSGEVPQPARLATLAQLSERELESLFPAGLLSLAWILAGVAPPPGSAITAAALPKGAAS